MLNFIRSIRRQRRHCAVKSARALEVRIEDVIKGIDTQVLGIENGSPESKNYDPMNGIYNV